MSSASTGRRGGPRGPEQCLRGASVPLGAVPVSLGDPLYKRAWFLGHRWGFSTPTPEGTTPPVSFPSFAGLDAVGVDRVPPTGPIITGRDGGVVRPRLGLDEGRGRGPPSQSLTETSSLHSSPPGRTEGTRCPCTLSCTTGRRRHCLRSPRDPKRRPSTVTVFSPALSSACLSEHISRRVRVRPVAVWDPHHLPFPRDLGPEQGSLPVLLLDYGVHTGDVEKFSVYSDCRILRRPTCSTSSLRPRFPVIRSGAPVL